MNNAQEFQALWTSFLCRVKRRWRQLTDDDLALLDSSVEQFVVRVQEKTGQGREGIERALGSLSKRGSGRMPGAVAALGASAQAVPCYHNSAANGAGSVLGKGAIDTHEEASGKAKRTPADFGLGMVAGLLVALAVRCACGQDRSGNGFI
jgi:uncharacterized protein YjbJ (UPF0337 family)